MGPIGRRGRGIIIAGVIAVCFGVAGFMILARPGDARQAVQPAATEPTKAANEILWVPRYDFALEVDGKPSPDACFYQEWQSRRILINAPDLPKICLLNQDGKQVTAIDRGKVAIDAVSDQARLLPGAETPGASSPYTVDQSAVVFYMGANRLKIQAKQPLVGESTTDGILKHSPLYKRGMQEYVPATADIGYLKSYKNPIEIEVFFGTWCPHCKVLVPKFMKTVEQAANPNLRIKYHGVPTSFDTYDPARSNGVKGIPTFIFWKDGKEVGRIPGDPGSDTIEHAVANILRGIKP